jgi:glycerol-3-phosphate acyltransferase PlsY
MPFIFAIFGYLIGSIPIGVIISRLRGIDIQEFGSGNIGATNISRALGPVPGILVYLLDFLKGFLAVYIGYWSGGDPLIVLIMGASVVIGHMFSVFLGFRGGKGVSTGSGVVAAIAPEIFLICILFMAFAAITTRYVSVASILTTILAVSLMFMFRKPPVYSIACLMVAALIIVSHSSNIKRLLQGTEPRLGDNK